MFRSSGRCAFVALVSALLATLCKCSGLGKCPKHDYMKDFDIGRAMGRWYEVERSFYVMELTSSCMDIDLTENSKGQIEVVVKTKSRWSGHPTISEGFLSQSRKDPSVLTYKVNSRLPNPLSRYLPGNGLYQVLNTDYINYAILWTCTNLALLHTDHVWIFGRQRDINATLRAEIYDQLAARHIDSERLILPKNASCVE